MFVSQKKTAFETPSSLVFDRKFDTALRDTTIKSFYARYENNEPTLDDQIIYNSPGIDWTDEPTDDPSLYADILSFILNSSGLDYVYTQHQVPSTSKISSLIKESSQNQLQWLLTSNSLPNKENLQTLIKDHYQTKYPSKTISNLLTCAHEISHVIDLTQKIKSPHILKLKGQERLDATLELNSYQSNVLPIKFIWSERILVTEWQNKWFIHPYPYLLMIHNKLCDLISVLIYSTYSEGICLEMGCTATTIRFVKHLCDLSMKYKNDFYHIVKALEALSIGETLVEVEEWENTTFLNTLSAGLLEKIKYRYQGSTLQHFLKNASIQFRHELACLSKIVGHPIVNIEAGVKSLHQKTNEVYELDVSYIQTTVRYAKRNFIKNYIVKHGRWPLVDFDPGTPTSLIRASMMNKDPDAQVISSRFGRPQITDYDYITLRPCMTFEKLENYIPYLKDKTISVLRSKVMEEIEKNEDKASVGNSRLKFDWKDTRLLLVYLLNPEIITDHAKFLQKYTYTTDLEHLMDYLVIRIVPKEKELKIDFRGFGCKTYEDRARAVCQEKNIKYFEEMYEPESTMAMGELELNSRMLAFRRIQKAYRNHKVLRINVDASSWNNRFRDETVAPVMSATLDKIFNYPIFSKTQKAFQNTLFYVDDEYETWYWEGQSGGIEGLNQDTWVAVYIPQIKAIMDRYNYAFHILCRGDDLRLVVLIPPTDHINKSMRDLKNEIVSWLMSEGQLLGHQIKVDDSYGSEVYFAFSKNASCNNIELPQVFRKIQKCYGANNAFLPFLDDFSGSTFSNAHSAAKNSVNPIGCYTVALFWFYYYLLTHVRYKELPDAALVALSLTPSLVGGLPIIFLHNMFVRAESDLLTPFISLIIFLENHAPAVSKFMKNFLFISKRPLKRLTALMMDPYSVNVDKPRSAANYLRSSLVPILASKSENRTILQLFKSNHGPFMKEFHDCVMSLNIVNPRVLSVIFAASPEGVVHQLIRKFETGRSVLELIIMRWGKGKADRILRTTARVDDRFHEWRIRRLQGRSQRIKGEQYIIDLNRCPAEQANQIREISWNKPIQGVTMPPPVHLITLKPIMANRDLLTEWDIEHHFKFTIFPQTELLSEDSPITYQSSGVRPFIGHATSAGTVEPITQFLEKDVIIIQIKNLIELKSWTAKETVVDGGQLLESNINLLIDRLISCYSTIDPEELAPFAGQRRSGTMTHHIRAPSFRESIVPNELSNIYQQIKGESNTHNVFRHSPEHFHVNFLHLFCFGTKMLFLESEFSPTISTPMITWAVTTDCNYCNIPIQEIPLIINEETLPVSRPPTIMKTKLGAVTKNILQTSHQAFIALHVREAAALTPISREDAQVGCLQLLIDSTVTRRKAVLDYSGKHALDTEGFETMATIAQKGKDQIVSLRTLKGISRDHMAKSVISTVYLEIMSSYGKLHDASASNIFLDTPGTELPWYGLVNEIHKLGKLGQLIRDICKIAKWSDPITSSNVSKAAQALGVICLKAQWELKEIPVLVIFSYYDDSNLLVHTKRVVQGLQWTIFNQEFRSSLKPCPKQFAKLGNPVYEKWFNDIMTPMGLTYIHFSIEFSDDKYHQVLMAELKETGTADASIFTTTECDIEALPTLDDISDSDDFINMFYVWKVYPHLPWESAIAYVHQNFAILIEKLDEIYTRWPLQVRFTDITQCISTVRREHHEAQSDTSEEFAVPEGPIRRPDQITAIRLDENTPGYKVPIFRHMRHDDDYNPDSHDYSLLWYHISPGTPYNLFSSSSHNVTLMLEVLSYTNLPRKVPDGSSIACLADGMGGIMSIFAKLFSDGRIVTCTLHEDSAVERLPESAMDAIETNNHVVFHRHNLSGHDNLVYRSTMIFLERLTGELTYVTCDAETLEWNTEERRVLLFNVVNYYLRKRTTRGILIMRVYLREARILSEVLSYLQSTSEMIYLIRPRSSRLDDVHYLFAQGTTGEGTLISYDTTEFPVATNIQNSFENYRNQHHKWFSDTTANRTLQLDLDVTLTQSHLRWGLLEELFCKQKLQNNLGLMTLPDDLRSALHNIPTGKELSKKDWLDNLPHLTVITRRVNFPGNAYEIGQSWDADTWTHHVYTIQKFLFHLGYFDCKSEWEGFDVVPQCSESKIRGSFVRGYNQINKRYKLPRISQDAFNTRTDKIIHGVPTNFFDSYLSGYRLGVLVYCTWRTIRKITNPFLLVKTPLRHPPLQREHHRGARDYEQIDWALAAIEQERE